MSGEANEKKSPSDSFADMIKEFGDAVAEIFNDPDLKKKAKEFGNSAADSGKAFADRFKDEKVKKKFRNLGKTAKDFGQSVSDYFSEEKDKSGQDSKKKQQNEIEKVQSGKVYIKDSERSWQPEYRSRGGSIAGYSFAIVWSIVFIIFLNFFNRYIAYYEYSPDSDSWNIYPLLTANFDAWLPVLNAALIASIIGNIILIINDSFYFKHITNIVLHFFGIAAVAALLVLFPFDFSVIPGGSLDAILIPILRIILILIIVGLSVGILVRFIRVIVRAVKSS